MNTNGKNGKAKRGRPSIPVSFGFAGGRLFTIDQALKNTRRRYPAVTRTTIYNHLMKEVRGRRISEVKAERQALDGRGHPIYRYRVKSSKKAAPVVAATA